MFQGLWGERHLDCGHPSPFSIIHIDILELLHYAELSLFVVSTAGEGHITQTMPTQPVGVLGTSLSPLGLEVQKIKPSLSGYVWPYFILD